jgi:hypothetical protein
MAWKINLGGDKEVELTDLSVDKLQDIADEEGVFWWDIVNQHPARSIQRFRAVVDACAEQAGISPSPSVEIFSAKDFIAATEGDSAWVREVTDIEDRPAENGFPPTASETATGSSTGVSESSDGLPTSSERSG